MATISANGGAERYWRHAPTGTRAVLCHNGKLLIYRGGWKLAKTINLDEIERDARWQPDTRPRLAAAITRTNREAARRKQKERTMTTTSELIRQIGPALCGRNWQTELAETMALNRRTMQRWLSGADEPRPGVWDTLDELLQARIAEQQRLRKVLQQHRAAQAGSARK